MPIPIEGLDPVIQDLGHEDEAAIDGDAPRPHELARTLENGCTVRRTNLEDVFIKLTGLVPRVKGVNVID